VHLKPHIHILQYFAKFLEQLKLLAFLLYLNSFFKSSSNGKYTFATPVTGKITLLAMQ